MVKKDTITMAERMGKMETDITYIKKGLDDNSIEHKEIRKLITDFVEAVDKKYADKDIEKTVEDQGKAINGINVHMAKVVGGSIAVTTIITWVIALLI